MAFQDTQLSSETKVAPVNPAKSEQIKQEKAQAREREQARVREFQQAEQNRK